MSPCHENRGRGVFERATSTVLEYYHKACKMAHMEYMTYECTKARPNILRSNDICQSELSWPLYL